MSFFFFFSFGYVIPMLVIQLTSGQLNRSESYFFVIIVPANLTVIIFSVFGDWKMGCSRHSFQRRQLLIFPSLLKFTRACANIRKGIFYTCITEKICCYPLLSRMKIHNFFPTLILIINFHVIINT